MGHPSYATVEQISAAADYKAAAHHTARLRRLALSASRRIEQRLRRHFYPLTETRSFYLRGGGGGFWLEGDLLELTSVTSDGDSIDIADVELSPGVAPFSWIDVGGVEVDVVGVWGYTDDTEPAGALAEALDDSETDVDVTDSAAVGIGDLIRVGSERMIVEAKAMLDTGQNTGGALTADTSDVTVAVTTGSDYHVGETLLVDSERMLIVDIADNNLTVRRAWDGSTLAAHNSGADIYAPRTLTVERGAAGTTAATHLTAASISRNVAPGAIVDLCVAEVIHTFEQETSGYGRTVGQGEGQREARGVGLAGARGEADRYRRVRVAAI